MKKIILLITFFFVMFQNIFSQIDYFDSQSKPSKDSSFFFARPQIGGEFNLTFGTYTIVSASPKIAYPITKFLNFGVGGDFIYYKYINLDDWIWGANIFFDLYFIKILFLHGEFQKLSVTNFASSSTSQSKVWVDALYLGIGYKQDISSRFFVQYSLLWDFKQSNFSVYTNPTYRVVIYFKL